VILHFQIIDLKLTTDKCYKTISWSTYHITTCDYYVS